MTASTTKKVRIATRGSRLALWQANFVGDLFRAKGYEPELVIVKTQGDIVKDRFLHEIGGKGLFVRELETALAEDRADIAVHSLKDLPAKTPKPFTLAAVLKRHVPYDLLIFKPASAARLTLPTGAIGRKDLEAMGALTVATASLRRQSLLKQVGPQFKLEAVRGNVDTRIKKLLDGDWDGLILAGASLERLGIDDLTTRPLDVSWFVPCAAQGALTIETLATSPFRAVAAELRCPETMHYVTMERKVLELMGGDCTMPFGCHIFYDEQAHVTRGRAVILNYEGGMARVEITSPERGEAVDAEAFVASLVKGLMDDGARAIFKDLDLKVPDLGKLTY